MNIHACVCISQHTHILCKHKLLFWMRLIAMHTHIYYVNTNFYFGLIAINLCTGLKWLELFDGLLPWMNLLKRIFLL